MMSDSTKRCGTARYYDALFFDSDTVFDRRHPQDLSLALQPRGNRFLALCRRFHAGDGPDILASALRNGVDYTYDGQTLTVFSSFLETIPVGDYFVFSAVFDRGQSAVFSVYSRPETIPSTYWLHDFADASAADLESNYKNEYFSDCSPDDAHQNEGRRTLRVDYQFEKWPQQVTAYLEPHEKHFLRCPRPYAVSVWVCGDASGNRLSLRLYNRYRTSIAPVNDIRIDWTGWKKIWFELPADIAMPIMWNTMIMLDCDEQSAARSGTIFVDRFEAVCDPAEAQLHRMGAPLVDWPHRSSRIEFDFEGTAPGTETVFSLRCTGDYRPVFPVALTCLAAYDTSGRSIPFAAPALFFQDDGTLRTSCFTDHALPNGCVFALQAADAAGETSSAQWLTAAADDGFYPQVPCEILRSITETPQTSAAFSCITSRDVPSCFLAYRPADAPDGAEQLVQAESRSARESACTIRVDGLPIHVEQECRAHAFRLDRLTPGTAYRYRLGSGEHWTKEFTFSTLPPDTAPNARCFDAVILADAHNGRNQQAYARFRELIQTGLRRTQAPVIFLGLGDLVDSAEDRADYRGTLDGAQDFFTSIPMAPTPGNHERDVVRWFDNYICHWNLPDCGVPEFRNLFYSFDLFDTHFTSICANGTPLTDRELSWLEQDLAGTSKKWKVVLMHTSPYGGKGAQDFNRRCVAPILDRYDVDLCLSGHEHIYVRASICRDQRVPLGGGVTYLTMGTSGPKAYENAKHDWQDYVYGDQYHERFVNGMSDLTSSVAHFSPNRIQIDVRTMSGRTVDAIVLEK